MTIRPDLLLAHRFPEARQRYEQRDAILYALGVGMGEDPLDERDLAYLVEGDLHVLPTFGVTLGSPGMWIRDPMFGVDFGRLVHSAQETRFHVPLPAEAETVSTARVVSLTDRGEDRGAVLALERTIADALSGTPYCTLVQTLLLRGDGGFGGPPAPREVRDEPQGPPTHHAVVTLSRRAALIYRLSGDLNPLHVDPAFARKAGFNRPIMHGLGTYGTAAVAVARALGREPDAMTAFSCRFTGIVIPGEVLEIDIWEAAGRISFEARVDERLVLGGGRAEFGEQR